jgi:tetratricopeptide (TPR) repeat protein
VDEVYLMLGRVYEKSAQIDEAARTYETLYHRNLSAKSRRASSYGAGRCHFRQENYVEASRWLVRYVGLATDPNPSDYADAYFLLARSEMARGNYDVAEQAIQRGLVGDPPNETAVPAMLNLAECHTRQEEFVNALGVMQELEKLDLTGEQLCQKALNTARLLREIGLVDKARNELRTELNQMNDPSQRGRIAIELARCHILGGDYESARQLLSQVMPDLRQGPELTEATVLMAEVSLLRGRPARAVQIAQPLLEGSASQAVRRKALRVIGEAYLDLKEYERAVMAFSGQNPGRWEDGE